MGIVIDSNGVINIAASTPGTYRITYTTAGTCPNSSTQDITINALPTITIANAGGGFCSGSSTTITTTVSAGTIFAWYKDDVLIVGQTGSSLVVTEAGEYKATVTDANGCTSVLSNGLDIEQFDSPSVTIATVPGTTICTGDTATLTANPTGGTGPYTYLWSTSATTQAISVSPTTTTTYTVTVTDANGCTATASQEITASTAGTTIASIDNDNAMSFNGVDAYVKSINSSISGVNNASISVWVKPTGSTINQYKAIVNQWEAVNSAWGIWLNGSGSTYAIHWNQNGSVGINSSSIVPNDQWSHIAIVKNATNLKMFHNGSEVSSFNVTAATGSNAVRLNIGAQYTTGTASTFFKGELDEVAIWNSALSSCDIKGIYEATTTVSGQPKTANLLDANTTIPAPVYWNRMGDS